MNKILKKILPYLILSVIFIFVWHKTLNQSFLGEGFYYFDRGQDFFTKSGISTVWEYNNFGKIIFDILPPIIGYNITLYQGFQLLAMIILTLVFYKFIKYFTRNSWISFTGAVVFSTSYLGLFEMIGVGNYERFVERIPNQIFFLLSFLELAKFYETGKTKKYIASLILFAISVFFAYFSTFLLPIYIIYPIVYSLAHKNKFKELLKKVIYSIPFVAINLFLISRSFYTPSGDFINFIKVHGLFKIISLITLQLCNMLIPPFIIEKIASVTSSYEGILAIITLPIIALFLLGIFLVKKRQKKLLTIYLSSVVMTPVLLFLNLYLGKVDPLYNMRGYTYYFLPKIYSYDPSLTATLKGDRYYMLPYLFVAIVISILIYVLLINLKKTYKIFSVVFITAYILYNAGLIHINIDKIQPASEDMKKYISYIESISPKLNNKSIIIVPREFLWPSSMIRSMYNYDLRFLADDMNWREQITVADYKNVIQIDYYYDKTKDGKIDPQNNHVIPLH